MAHFQYRIRSISGIWVHLRAWSAMFKFLMKIRENLIAKIIVATGGIMLVSTLVLVYLSIAFVNTHTLSERIKTADMMGNIIKLGLHNAMLHNSRGEIDQIINKVAELHAVSSIRVYNKDGEIKFSNNPAEEGTIIDTNHQACRVCHQTEPPKNMLPLEERTRDFFSPEGEHFFSVLTPIDRKSVV